MTQNVTQTPARDTLPCPSWCVMETGHEWDTREDGTPTDRGHQGTELIVTVPALLPAYGDATVYASLSGWEKFTADGPRMGPVGSSWTRMPCG
jgi:hypothetical protein